MLSLWQMSLSVGAVILLTALLRRWAADRLPRRMYVALWDIALLAGLIPFRVPWEALSRLVQSMKAAVTRSGGAVLSLPLQTIPRLQDTGRTVSEAVTAAIPLEAPLLSGTGVRESLTQVTQPLMEAVGSAPDWLWHALGTVWALGAILLVAVIACRWASCLRVFSEALPCGDQRVAAFLREHPLRRWIRVRVSARVSSPLSYGLLRPVILLPAAMAGTDDRALTHVLTHEFMHIRAWDILRKRALLLVLCLHWFNPLVWVMIRLCNRDMELMCDERVVRRLGGRKAYCMTLLDMEAERSRLTMGTCFSVTGIEERIKVMKNRKHQGILSIALAFAIFLGAAAGAMIGMPLAGAEKGSPRLGFSRETWEASYAKYEIYGLGYDEENGTITYNGQVVRYFEDMWPVDEQGKAGACFIYEGGTVDVYGVREFPEFIQRNPDGSFDPSGILIGLREATKEEFDERTARQKAYMTIDTATAIEYAYQVVDTAVPGSNTQAVAADKLAIEWWTAEEYREWMEEERTALQELVDEQARTWTPSRGWFTWTQELADEAMARYEETLREIEQGNFVSKTINGEEANMVLVQGLGNIAYSFAVQDTVEGSGIPSAELSSDDSVAKDTETSIVYASHVAGASTYGQELDLGSAVEGQVVLVAVGPGDEWRYTPEEWAMIQELVDAGLVQWSVPTTSEQGRETAFVASSHLTTLAETWRETIAPYAPFGLSCEVDSATERARLYWNGREIRGVFDPERGMWITEHTGNSYYPEGAKELIAVYADGQLVGLREANAEESAVWDALREENAKSRGN